jgi:hypothetical protein
MTHANRQWGFTENLLEGETETAQLIAIVAASFDSVDLARARGATAELTALDAFRPEHPS